MGDTIFTRMDFDEQSKYIRVNIIDCAQQNDVFAIGAPKLRKPALKRKSELPTQNNGFAPKAAAREKPNTKSVSRIWFF